MRGVEAEWRMHAANLEDSFAATRAAGAAMDAVADTAWIAAGTGDWTIVDEDGAQSAALKERREACMRQT